jgi:hypothetical protein
MPAVYPEDVDADVDVAANVERNVENESLPFHPHNTSIGGSVSASLLLPPRPALDLNGMVSSNMKVIKQRGRSLDIGVDGRQRGENRRNKEPQDAVRNLSMSGLWEQYLCNLDPLFLDPQDKEASLLISQNRVEKDEKALKGLMLTVHTKADVQSIFKNCYGAKFVRGQPITTFHMFRNVVGQFARFSIVCGNLTAEDVCSPGSLFESVVYLKTIKVYISYFQLRCASYTVLCKDFHLKVLAGHTVTFLLERKTPTVPAWHIPRENT